MNKEKYIGIFLCWLIGSITGGIAGEYLYLSFNEQKTVQCDIFDIPEQVRKAECKIIEPQIIHEYVPRYITVEKNCDTEKEEGRLQGWKECIETEATITSQKRPKEYCRTHFCETPILRNTRPHNQ